MSHIDHTDHFAQMSRVIERFRQATWKEYERDPKFCHVCAFRGYQMMTIAGIEEALSDPGLSEQDRAELTEELTLTLGMVIPTHEAASTDRPVS